MDKTRVEICQLSLEDILVNDKTNYIVPRYQREYAWTEDETNKMLADLWAAFQNASSRNYYFGTLVVQPKNQSFEVIDGQQRLTTFMLLSPMLSKGRSIQMNLKFANRPEVDDFLKEYSDCKSINEFLVKSEENSKLCHFFEAISNLLAYKPSSPDGNEHPQSMENGLLDEIKDGCSFREYILKKVMLFKVIMPAGTDAMAYFEVMNNRGEQLQYHELLKAYLNTVKQILIKNMMTSR